MFNNISNGDKLQCQRTSDNSNTGNSFSSLFANVLGSDHSKQNCPISDSSLIISLLRLCSSLIQTELPRQLTVSFSFYFFPFSFFEGKQGFDRIIPSYFIITTSFYFFSCLSLYFFIWRHVRVFALPFSISSLYLTLLYLRRLIA